MDAIVKPEAREKSRDIFGRDIITVRMEDFLLKANTVVGLSRFHAGFILYSHVYISKMCARSVSRISFQHTQAISPSILSSVIQSPHFNCMLRESSRQKIS